jgi:hypothetical protein
MSRVILPAQGPMKPPRMPPASVQEIAFGFQSVGAMSAAAKRYCRPKAL